MFASGGLKLVIFDLDGTLVDAFPAIADSVNHMLRQYGISPQPLCKVRRSVGWGVDHLVRAFVPESYVAKALDIFCAHHDKNLHKGTKVLPGVRALLAFLKKRGCILAVASNRPQKFCRAILQATGIECYFDHVVCADMVGRSKPHPDMVKVILRKTAVRRAHALMVGDMVVDVACARAAGVMVAAVTTGSSTAAELKAQKPDLLVRRIGGVRRLWHPRKS